MTAQLALPAELTSAQATACLAELSAGLAQAAAAGSAVVVDAARLERFDSSALAVLLELRRVCAAAGRPYAVQALPERLHELARVYGVASLLTPAASL